VLLKNINLSPRKEGLRRTNSFVLLLLMGLDRFHLCNDMKKSDMHPRVKRHKKTHRYSRVYSSALPLLDICMVYK